MKTFLLSLALFSILTSAAIGQTPIGGQINQYTVVESADACPGRIEVQDASGFNVAQKVLLIQMQGAVINQQNASAYGTITDLNNAGSYEFNRILSFEGNTIQLENELVHSYDLSGVVQLIAVPEYSSAIVTSTLEAAPWDGQTGGVLVLNVSDTLTLSADLDVSGLGFRGGQVQDPESDCAWFINENDYSYEAGNWRGSWKGEGVAAYTPGQELGRGALANGGGGGNDHNTGGGGGSLRTAGGIGGLQTPPSIFGCSGDFPGIGGKALPGEEFLWLGGAGGAGHTDNPGAGSAGGNGGGILILEAGHLIGNGYAIRANGATALTANGDGAGGGGAGGTIVLLAETWDGMLEVTATGGTGGNTDNVINRCFGPGGGGSGGAVFTNLGALPNLLVSGGLSGENENPNSNCTDLANGATGGLPGSQEFLIELLVADNMIQLPVIVTDLDSVYLFCEFEDGTLVLNVAGSDLIYQWQADLGNGFEILSNGVDFAGTTTNELQLLDLNGLPEGAQFQCLITHPCFGALSSQIAEVEVGQLPEANFSFTISDLEVTFMADPDGESFFLWDFGDSNQGSSAQVVHDYNEEGIYIVELTVMNDCGTVSQVDTVYLGALPEVSFNVNLPGGCAPLEVQFTDFSSGGPTEWMWTFPGGDPATSDEQNPTVLYSDTGVYDATLTATNTVGSTTATLTGILEVLEPPLADFTFTVEGDTVSFVNTSSGDFTSVQWVFGDGSDPSDEAAPDHVYSEEGVFEVTLSVTNAYCGSFVTLPVEIIPTATLDEDLCQPNFWPNPATQVVNVQSCYPGAEIRLYDLRGREVLYLKSENAEQRVTIGRLPAGVYCIEVRFGSGVWREKLVIH